MSRLRLRLRHRAGEFALDVDLDLPAGIAGICGPSGAGKSSLLRAVAGLTKDVVGEVRIGDAVWLDARRALPAHERAVGMVFQDACLFPHLTVRGNLEFGARRLPGGEAAAALGDIAALAERLGITALLARRPAHLSGGEAQRVGIARALALRPQLLLLDEPLAALDPARREALLPWLAGTIRAAGIPALYVSHSPDELARVADHLVVMEQGRVTAHGPLGDLLTRLDLPLAHTRDAESLLEAVVAEYDAQWALARVAFAGGSLWVPMPTAEIGRRVRLRLRAGDVSLALAAHADTSIVNVLPARVLALADSGPSQVLAQLAVGETVLLSRITRRSAVALGLAPGIDLYVQIKGVAILGEG